jgi:hypothetical protein
MIKDQREYQGAWNVTLGGQRPLARGHVSAQAKLPEAAPGD